MDLGAVCSSQLHASQWCEYRTLMPTYLGVKTPKKLVSGHSKNRRESHQWRAACPIPRREDMSSPSRSHHHALKRKDRRNAKEGADSSVVRGTLSPRWFPPNGRKLGRFGKRIHIRLVVKLPHRVSPAEWLSSEDVLRT